MHETKPTPQTAHDSAMCRLILFGSRFQDNQQKKLRNKNVT